MSFRSRLRRPAAFGVLASFVASLLLPLSTSSHAIDRLDPGEPLLAAYDPHPHVAEAPDAATDGHCQICHLQRAWRSAQAALRSVIQPHAAATPLTPVAPDLVVRVLVDERPSRAPPLS